MDQRQYLDNLLDKCIALSLDGMSTEEVLELHLEHEEKLKPLLRIAMLVHQVPEPVPSPTAKLTGRTRLLNAVSRKRFELLFQGESPQEKMPIALAGT